MHKHHYQSVNNIVNILSAKLDQVLGTSCNRPFGVWAQIIRTTHPVKGVLAFKTTLYLKNCPRNRLLPERLDTLMVISAEGPLLQEFQFERTLIKWKTEKT